MRYNVTPRRCPVFLVYAIISKPRGLDIFYMALLNRHLEKFK